MKKKSDPKSKFGIIAMVDALGMRNATVAESKQFIGDIQTFLKHLPKFMADYFNQLPNTPKSKKFNDQPPQLATFGDTLIFSWEITPQELSAYIPDVGFFLSYVILWGLENKIAFRGAVSVGDYIQSEATVLGPAISDAAAWHDCPEMIGIIATPFSASF